jgi:hypothetical protein
MTPAAAARRSSRQSTQTVRPVIVCARWRVGPNARPQSGHVSVTQRAYEQGQPVASDAYMPIRARCRARRGRMRSVIVGRTKLVVTVAVAAAFAGACSSDRATGQRTGSVSSRVIICKASLADQRVTATFPIDEGAHGTVKIGRYTFQFLVSRWSYRGEGSVHIGLYRPDHMPLIDSGANLEFGSTIGGNVDVPEGRIEYTCTARS